MIDFERVTILLPKDISKVLHKVSHKQRLSMSKIGISAIATWLIDMGYMKGKYLK